MALSTKQEIDFAKSRLEHIKGLTLHFESILAEINGERELLVDTLNEIEKGYEDLQGKYDDLKDELDSARDDANRLQDEVYRLQNELDGIS